MTDPTTVVVRVEHPVPDYELWKREAFADGRSQWVEARASDDMAAARWLRDAD